MAHLAQWSGVLFFISHTPQVAQRTFVAWAGATLATHPETVRTLIAPALRGLRTAIDGRTPPRDADAESPDGVRFLGRTTGRHWLMELIGMGAPAKESRP